MAPTRMLRLGAGLTLPSAMVGPKTVNATAGVTDSGRERASPAKRLVAAATTDRVSTLASACVEPVPRISSRLVFRGAETDVRARSSSRPTSCRAVPDERRYLLRASTSTPSLRTRRLRVGVSCGSLSAVAGSRGLSRTVAWDL